MPLDNDLPFALVMLICLAGLGCGLLSFTRHRDNLHTQMQSFLVALVVRFVMAVIIYEFGFLKVLGDEDSSGWYSGVALMRDWTQRQVSILDLPAAMAQAFQYQHRGYAYLVGGLFYLTD